MTKKIFNPFINKVDYVSKACFTKKGKDKKMVEQKKAERKKYFACKNYKIQEV